MKHNHVVQISIFFFPKFRLLKKLLLHKQLVSIVSILAILLLIITACTPSSQPESTPIPPSPTLIPSTSTQISPTATMEPTATATLLPTEVVILRPSPRYCVSFAFDSESNQIILFGGAIGYNGPIILDTWAYDVAANHWKEMNPANVPGGIGFLAYDSESDRVIMFSLFSGNYWNLSPTNQTWAYDYNTDTWTRMTNHPRKIIGGPIAYDVESDRIILFGGFTPPKFQYPETWAFDYNTDTWTEMQPSVSPHGRDSHLMTYDVKADRILTFGGDITSDNLIDESLWSYDFNADTWQELKPDEASHPLSRFYSSLAYDTESDRTILFGGLQLGKDYGTWAYDYNTNTWLDMKPAEDPGHVKNHYLAYISSIDRVFLFGGDVGEKYRNLSNEIWVYDFNSNTWENIIPLP